MLFHRARPTRLTVLQPGRRAVRRRRSGRLAAALVSLAVVCVVVLLLTVTWPS